MFLRSSGEPQPGPATAPGAGRFRARAVADMKRLVFAVAIAACGNLAEQSERVPRPLVFERWSPAQASSHDVFVAAHGSILVMANRISRDGGATWTALPPPLGQLDRVVIEGSTAYLHASELGLARWDLATDQITPIAAPAFASAGTWRRDRAGRLIAFDPVENAVAVERTGGWAPAALPRPAETELRPYIFDLESNGSTMLTVSGWGVHRSVDGGATWQLSATGLTGAGRDLLVLGDDRFLLVGGATSYLFSATGEPGGPLVDLVVGHDQATVCDDGSIIAAGRVTRDLGATWQPLVAVGDLEITIERANCGAGSYWVLMRSASWGYRLLRFSQSGAPGEPGVAIGNWGAAGPQAWSSSGLSIVRDSDGTFLAGGLAWRDGDAAWTLREMPARTWSSRGILFGVAGARSFTSSDAGRTWTAIAASGLDATQPASFARGPDGAFYVGELISESAGTTDTWRATVWRSIDLGASWSVAYRGIASRTGGASATGAAHLFVGITDDGTWVATDAISRDGGASWTATHTVGDRSLAHLMPDGSLVMQPADLGGETWRVYASGGLGDLLATHAIEADGQPVLAAQLRSVAFDDAGHAYVARGTPHVQIWRSTTPVQRRDRR